MQASFEKKTEFGKESKRTFKRNVYVDNLLKSVKNKDMTIKLSQYLIMIYKTGRFILTKFINNSIEIWVKTVEARQFQNIINQDLDVGDLLAERALGVLWNIEYCYLGFEIHLKYKPLTRRNPFYHQFHLLQHHLYKSTVRFFKSSVNLKLTEMSFQNQWMHWRNKLSVLKTIKVSRCYKLENVQSIVKADIAALFDTNKKSYGQCLLFRITDQFRTIHCSLLIEKSAS